MKKIIYFLLTALIGAAAVSCDLEEQPISATGRDAIFGNEDGLKLYVNSLYGTPPQHGWVDLGDGYGFKCFRGTIEQFDPSYNGADRAVKLYYGTPRACNYFLENNNNKAVSEEIRNNYNGIVRYFRAMWYADQMRSYSDFPIIDHVVDINDMEALYPTRNPRSEVAEFIYEDFKYALDNIIKQTEANASVITKNVVAFQMSRFCLNEASWRKYHSELNLASTANDWYRRAVEAAEVVINSGKQSLHANWLELFQAAKPTTIADEGIFIWQYGSAINSYHCSTKSENSPSFYGGPNNRNRIFVNMILNADGSRFTDNEAYKTMLFADECKGRDPRFAMTFRTPAYERIQTDGKKHKAGLAMDLNYNGYLGRKFCSDNERYDNETDETTCVVPMRYAELLLNWAEAKAELGEFTDADWAASVGAIRKRAGITGGLDKKPTVADPYLMQYFKHTTDATLLEIVRERFVELLGEGHSQKDIYRWGETQIIELPQYGMYVEALDTPLDLDADGEADTYFYTTENIPADAVKTITYVPIDGTPGLGIKKRLLSVAEDGHTLVYNCLVERPKFMERCYYSPISTQDIVLNPKLKQTPGW